jgi:hypothetical protein
VIGADGEPGDPSVAAPGEPQVPGMPMVVDQYGNPVDDETARAILEQMARDAHEAQGLEGHEGPGRGRGRGRGKRKDD